MLGFCVYAGNGELVFKFEQISAAATDALMELLFVGQFIEVRACAAITAGLGLFRRQKLG